MRILGHRGGTGAIICWAILLQVASGVTIARAGDALPAAGGPFGGCEPIGLTASGELVFPLECKKAVKKAVGDKAASEAKPAAADPAAVPSQAAAADTKLHAAEPSETTGSADAKTADAKTADAKTADAKALESKAPEASAPDAKAPDTKTALTKTAVTKTAAVPSGPAGTTPAAAAEKVAPASRAKLSGKASRKGADKVALRGAERRARVATVKVPAAKPEQAHADAAASVKSAQGGPVTRIAVSGVRLAARVADVAPAARREAPVARPQRVAMRAGDPPCTHYRSYNPVKKTYLSYDGHIYACR